MTLLLHALLAIAAGALLFAGMLVLAAYQQMKHDDKLMDEAIERAEEE